MASATNEKVLFDATLAAESYIIPVAQVNVIVPILAKDQVIAIRTGCEIVGITGELNRVSRERRSLIGPQHAVRGCGRMDRVRKMR